MEGKFPKQTKKSLPKGPGSKVISYGDGAGSTKMRVGSSDKSHSVPSSVAEVKGPKK
jgi:hypothetical protein